MLAGEALPAQCNDRLDGLGRRRAVEPARPGRTIRKPSRALCPEAAQPLVRRPRRYPQRRGNLLDRLSSLDPANKIGSTMRGKAGILVHVHSGRSWIPAVW